MSDGRWGTGEEGEGGEDAGGYRRGNSIDHADDGDGRGRGRGMHYLNGDVGGGAEGAVRVRVGAVRVDVGHLDGARGDDQEDTQGREEKSPGGPRAPRWGY
jgi:energy-converting hydrogenase Eha subunit B